MEDNENIVDFIVSGLMTDGAHHKQWYLEQILRRVINKEGIESLKETFAKRGYSWESGVAP